MFKSSLVLLTAALLCSCALVPSGDERVQKPIDATYEPLNGSAWNHRYSPELDELRSWQEARDRFEAEYEPEPDTITAGSSVPADRIHEPQPAPLPAGNTAEIEEDEASLRIRD